MRSFRLRFVLSSRGQFPSNPRGEGIENWSQKSLGSPSRLTPNSVRIYLAVSLSLASVACERTTGSSPFSTYISMLLALELVSAMHKRVSASVDSRECNVSLRFPSCWRASKPNNGSSSKADMQGQSKRGETEAANSEYG